MLNMGFVDDVEKILNAGRYQWQCVMLPAAAAAAGSTVAQAWP
jgi:superfamily II DNA/RNA helicase